MNKITVDGIEYDVYVEYESLTRSVEFVEGDGAGTTLTGKRIRDLVAVGQKYNMTFVQDPSNPLSYNSFYEAITSPTNYHTFELPYNGKTINFDAYVKSGSDTFVGSYNGHNLWNGLSIDLTAYKPNYIRVYMDGNPMSFSINVTKKTLYTGQPRTLTGSSTFSTSNSITAHALRVTFIYSSNRNNIRFLNIPNIYSIPVVRLAKEFKIALPLEPYCYRAWSTIIPVDHTFNVGVQKLNVGVYRAQFMYFDSQGVATNSLLSPFVAAACFANTDILLETSYSANSISCQAAILNPISSTITMELNPKAEAWRFVLADTSTGIGFYMPFNATRVLAQVIAPIETFFSEYYRLEMVKMTPVQVYLNALIESIEENAVVNYFPNEAVNINTSVSSPTGSGEIDDTPIMELGINYELETVEGTINVDIHDKYLYPEVIGEITESDNIGLDLIETNVMESNVEHAVTYSASLLETIAMLKANKNMLIYGTPDIYSQSSESIYISESIPEFTYSANLFTKQQRLPLNYTELQYIISNENTMINTGFYPDVSQYRIRAVVYDDDPYFNTVRPVYHAGPWDSYSQSLIEFSHRHNASYKYSFFHGTRGAMYVTGVSTPADKIMTIFVAAGTSKNRTGYAYMWDSSENLLYSTTLGYYTQAVGEPLILLGYGSIGTGWKGRLYSFRYYCENTFSNPQLNLVPAINEDTGKVGLYDIYNSHFYTSTTGYDFEAGPEV